MSLSAYQAKYYAHELQRSYANDHVGKLAGLLFDAQVEPKPHQIDAALFALQTPYLPGVVLADEVGLGKTIEAGIVITQYWAERRRRILICSRRRENIHNTLDIYNTIRYNIITVRTKHEEAFQRDTEKFHPQTAHPCHPSNPCQSVIQIKYALSLSRKVRASR